jgi:hypothetical protein
MSSSPRFGTIASITVCAGTLLAGCAPLHRGPVPPPAVEEITVHVANCLTDNIRIAVHPWEAWVRRGRPLEWVVTGVDSMVVEPRVPDRWPFQERPTRARRDPREPERPARASAGNVLPTAPVYERYQYDIILHCGARVIRIDPDIIIRNGME